MRVQFEATLDELVDAVVRLGSRSKLAERSPWPGMIVWGVMFGLIAGVPSFFVLVAELELKLVVFAVLTSLGAMVGILVYLSSYRQSSKRMLRERLKIQVETASEGITEQVTYGWSQIEQIQETADSIDFLTQAGGVVVGKKAFTSSDQMREFVEEANRFRDQFRESFTTREPD